MNRKRIFDITVTLVAAPAWVPALILCSLAIWIAEGRPIFYVSLRRVGQRARPIIKFRTMVRDAERVYNRDMVPVSGSIRFLNTPPDSPLYTRVGRIIERFGLTEVPQVLHVLKGDMSLVGNRPLPENVISSLREVYPDVEQRFSMPAGMTGPVQLVGRTEMDDRQRLDIELAYCRVARSAPALRRDFLILLHTVRVVLRLRPAFTIDEVLSLIGDSPDARGVRA